MTGLRDPFPPSQVGRMDRGRGVILDYVGHGAVTARLLDVDPEWNWEPAAFTDEGLPLLTVDPDGVPIGLWIKLTILGVTRWGFGSCPHGQFDAEKVLIGDAIRNAAMRFGVALDLWIRGDGTDEPAEPAPSGFESHDEWERVVVETRELAAALPAGTRDDYRTWFTAQGFQQPWDRIDCDRMLGKITELSTRPDTLADIVGGPE